MRFIENIEDGRYRVHKVGSKTSNLITEHELQELLIRGEKILGVSFNPFKVSVIDEFLKTYMAKEKLLKGNSITITRDKGTFTLNGETDNIPEFISILGDKFRLKAQGDTNIVIGDYIQEINADAFKLISEISSIKLSAYIKLLPNFLLHNKNLQIVELPSKLEAIGDNCFSNNYMLKDMKLPKGVVSIGDYAFAECHSLTNINLPDKLTYLGRKCFSNCHEIKQVNIPYGVDEIDGSCFHECSDNLQISVSRKFLEKVSYSNGKEIIYNDIYNNPKLMFMFGVSKENIHLIED